MRGREGNAVPRLKFFLQTFRKLWCLCGLEQCHENWQGGHSDVKDVPFAARVEKKKIPSPAKLWTSEKISPIFIYAAELWQVILIKGLSTLSQLHQLQLLGAVRASSSPSLPLLVVGGFCQSGSCMAALPAPTQTSQGQGAASAWARGREEPAGSWGSLDQAPVWLGKAGRSALLQFTAFCPDFIWRIPVETQHFAWSKSKQCSVLPFFKASLHLQTSLIPLASQQDAFLFKEQREAGVQEEPSQQEPHAAQRLGRRPPASLQCHEFSSEQIRGSFNIDESDTSKPVSFIFIFFKQEHRMLWTISPSLLFRTLWISPDKCHWVPNDTKLIFQVINIEICEGCSLLIL